MDKASGTFDLHGFCLLVGTACHFLATSCVLYADTVPLGKLTFMQSRKDQSIFCGDGTCF